jgi:N-acetylglucosaminyldiphosphoundecaprenol N-acetyl-beta-D-mannosaminyltransferase
MIIELAGVKIDNLTLEECVSKLEEFVAQRTPHLIVTPNPEIIVASQKDAQLRKIVNAADLRLADGISMIVVSRLLGRPLKERVTGIDFMLKVCELAAKMGWKIFLLGSSPVIVKAAAEALMTRYPGIRISDYQSGYFSPEEEKGIITRIRESKTDILFAGLGMGRQEKWLAEHLYELNVPVSMGIGGSLDVVSGQKRRAPRFIQALYIEWLYRLIIEPWRLKRQLALPRFLWLTLLWYNFGLHEKIR